MALSNFFVDSLTIATPGPVTSHVTDSGHNWIKVIGAATPNTFTSFDGCIGGPAELVLLRSSVMAANADMSVSVPFYTFSGAMVSFGITARLNADGTAGYLANYTYATQKWGIYRITGSSGARVLVAESATQAQNPTNPTVAFGVTTSGNAVAFTLTVNDTAVITGATDADASRVTANGYVGLWLDRTGQGADDGVFPQSFTAQSEPATAASALVLSGASTGNIGAAITIRVTTDNPITAGSYTVALSDGASGTFSPAVVLSASVPYVDVTYTAAGAAGSRTVTATTTGLTTATKTLTLALPDTTVPTFVSATTDGTGTEITLTFSEPLGATVPGVTAFMSNELTFGAVVINGSTVKLTGIVPAILGGESVPLSYAKPATNGLRDPSGNQVESFFAPSITNIVPIRPVLAGYVLKTYGDDPAHDFSTPAQLAAYLQSLNCVTLGSKVMIWLYKDLWWVGQPGKLAGCNDDYYVTLRPAPGLSFEEIEPAITPGNYGTQGIEITCDGSALSLGIVTQACRIALAGAGQSLNINRENGSQSGTKAGFYGCRANVTGTGTAIVSGFGAARPTFADTLFLSLNGNGNYIINNQGSVDCVGSTFVRQGAGVGTPAVANAADNNTCHDNVFSGCGGVVFGNNVSPQTSYNNFTDTPLDAPKDGFTYVSGPFFESATDFRPAANSVLIGAGSYRVVSTNDNNGNNRGTTPDAGAFQRTPAQPLVIAQITYYDLTGQVLTVRGTTTNSPSSGMGSLTPAATPNGAASKSLSLTFPTDGTFEVVFTGITPGDYRDSLFTFTNGGGTVAINGLGFTVAAISGTPMAAFGDNAVAEPPPTSTVPVATISTATTAIMSGKTATLAGTVDLRGDAAGTAQVFLDPQPSGTPILLGSLTNGAFNQQYVIPKGLYQLRVAVTANGQTATAKTASFRVQGLTGNFTLLAS